MSSFARSSVRQMSARRLVRPKEDRKKPVVIEMEDKSGVRRPLADGEGEAEPLSTTLNTSMESQNSAQRPTTPIPPSGADNCCILCVGSTGTGKSSTIARLTEQRVKASDSLRRVTQRCKLYRPVFHSKNCIFEQRNIFVVDTVGWEDADSDDDDSFKEILRFVNANNIVNIKAVIWTVNRSIRQDALLNRQAALINKFYEKDIWNRVIIVCKQTENPDRDCRGALAAGLDYNPRANIQTTGFYYLDDSSFTMDQSMSLENDPKMRDTWNVKTDDEIRETFKYMLDGVGDPIKIVFNDKRCLDCGAIGDPRLLPKFCHLKKMLVHRVKDAEHVHPMAISSFHPEEIPIKTHPGYMHRSPWYKSIKRKQIYSCCGGKLTSSGCALKWKCCGQQHKINKPNQDSINPSLGCRKRYTCCNQDVENAAMGCEQLYSCCGRNKNQDPCLAICVKCEREWGTEADKCYIKRHTVVDLKDDDVETSTKPKDVKDQFATVKKVENGLLKERTFLEKCELPSTLPFPII